MSKEKLMTRNEEIKKAYEDRDDMKQAYSFAEHMRIGEHDDNIDALNSSYNMQTMVV